MKTVIKFEPKDFKGSGQLIIRNSSEAGAFDIPFALSVSFKIGYICGPVPGPAKIARISMNDGMIVPYESLEDLCKNLNEDKFGFRLMSSIEIAAILTYEGNRFP